MTLDEAIEHAEEVARTCDDSQCAKDHAQLSDWLRELKQLREERDEMRTNVTMATLWQDTLKTAIDRLRAENARLRELVRRLLTEYRYMRVRPRRAYLGHEERMRAIEGEMSELGIEVEK